MPPIRLTPLAEKSLRFFGAGQEVALTREASGPVTFSNMVSDSAAVREPKKRRRSFPRPVFQQRLEPLPIMRFAARFQNRIALDPIGMNFGSIAERHPALEHFRPILGLLPFFLLQVGETELSARRSLATEIAVVCRHVLMSLPLARNRA